MRLPDGFARSRELGFGHLEQPDREAIATGVGRLCRRWFLTFCDSESVSGWMGAAKASGLQHVRVGAWIKEGCTPQFSGDRPATRMEAIVISHPPGRKRWNGGGSRAIWPHPIVTGSNSERTEHTTQKPLSLMLELVSLFTDPGETVLDPFAGSGTTGVACIRLGRRFIGIEKNEKYAEIAAKRLEAESRGQSLREFSAGQLSFLGPP
jgi:site-specific DNA-methyltransferase (adenine-specific)